MSEFTDEQLMRFIEITHSTDIPVRYIRIMANELFYVRKQRDTAIEELAAARDTIERLRDGDTCARMCEGTAYRTEARRLQREVDALREEWRIQNSCIADQHDEISKLKKKVTNKDICQTDRDAWTCKNMKEVLNDLDMDAEHYECKVCKRTIKLYYDEMR